LNSGRRAAPVESRNYRFPEPDVPRGIGFARSALIKAHEKGGLPMASSHVPLMISGVWLFLVVVTTFFLDASMRGWVLAMMVGVVPAVVLLMLWKGKPGLTVAEVLHPTEGRR
jgi:hypothetical protein